MSNESKKKRGRPRQDVSRRKIVNTRMSDTEYNFLTGIGNSTGISLAEIIRIGAIKYASELSSNKAINDAKNDENSDYFEDFDDLDDEYYLN